MSEREKVFEEIELKPDFDDASVMVHSCAKDVRKSVSQQVKCSNATWKTRMLPRHPLFYS